jgi:hypothetical protein
MDEVIGGYAKLIKHRDKFTFTFIYQLITKNANGLALRIVFQLMTKYLEQIFVQNPIAAQLDKRIVCLLWKEKLQYCVYKSLPLERRLS